MVGEHRDCRRPVQPAIGRRPTVVRRRHILSIIILRTLTLPCSLTPCHAFPNALSITPYSTPTYIPFYSCCSQCTRLICSVGLYHIASSLFPDTSICYHPRRHRVDGDDDHDNDGDGSMAQGENIDGSGNSSDDNGHCNHPPLRCFRTHYKMLILSHLLSTL